MFIGARRGKLKAVTRIISPSQTTSPARQTRDEKVFFIQWSRPSDRDNCLEIVWKHESKIFMKTKHQYIIWYFAVETFQYLLTTPAHQSSIFILIKLNSHQSWWPHHCLLRKPFCFCGKQKAKRQSKSILLHFMLYVFYIMLAGWKCCVVFSTFIDVVLTECWDQPCTSNCWSHPLDPSISKNYSVRRTGSHPRWIYM